MNFWEWLTQPRYTKLEPRYTKLEQELAKRIDYLEIELHNERERYRAIMERVAFPPSSDFIRVPEGPFQSVPQINKVQAEAQRLSRLSRERLDAQIAEMESRAASVSVRDERLSRKANDEKAISKEEGQETRQLQ